MGFPIRRSDNFAPLRSVRSLGPPHKVTIQYEPCLAFGVRSGFAAWLPAAQMEKSVDYTYYPEIYSQGQR